MTFLRGRPTLPNRFAFPDVDKEGNSFDTSAKRRVLAGIDSNTAVFVTMGQSRIANNSSPGQTQYQVTHPAAALNLNPYDATFYVADDPLLGCSASAGYSQAGWQGRMCDELISDGAYQKVVLIPIAVAGSSISEWVPGAAYAPRISAINAMLGEMGITPTAWLCQIGTTDAIAGMSQATFAANLRSVISSQRSAAGREGDAWVIAQDTINGTGNSTSSAIRAAVASVAADAGNHLGPDIDVATYPTYSDGTHFKDAGNVLVAGLWADRLEAIF